MMQEYECTMIAKDIPGSEGPCFNLDGEFFMVAPNLGQILRVSEDGKVTEFANTGGTPAGLQCDKRSNLWCADMKLGILRISPDGKVHHEVVKFEGKPMRGCNDCAFDSKGNLYVTAPAGSGEGKPEGEVYCRLRDGKVVRLDTGFQFCNGIAVSYDDRTLIVAETMTRSLWAYDIEAPGKLRNKRLWARHPEPGLGPDGMDFDEKGNLLVAYWGGGTIDVFDRMGKPVKRIRLPFEKPSNVHFGGPENRTLYITEHDTNGLWKLEYEFAGQPQYCNR